MIIANIHICVSNVLRFISTPAPLQIRISGTFSNLKGKHSASVSHTTEQLGQETGGVFLKVFREAGITSGVEKWIKESSELSK